MNEQTYLQIRDRSLEIALRVPGVQAADVLNYAQVAYDFLVKAGADAKARAAADKAEATNP